MNITRQMIKTYNFFTANKDWKTRLECTQYTGVSNSTIKNHCELFVSLGILEKRDAYPSFIYRPCKVQSRKAKEFKSVLEIAERNYLELDGKSLGDEVLTKG